MKADTLHTPPFHTEIKTFPITVPILGAGPKAPRLITPPAQEQWSEPEWVADGSMRLRFSRSAFEDLIGQMGRGQWGDLDWHRMAIEAEQLTHVPPLGEWMCLEHSRSRRQEQGVIPYPHQVRALDRVIRRMGGRAILADEVGLGKTIEAGMILQEYMLRGRVCRALILVPVSLSRQWYEELKNKFGIVASLQSTAYDWARCDILIASIDTAKREPHRTLLLDQTYDLVIIDEAHKLKNRETLNWKLVSAIRKRYLLLLTATPIQNDLMEIFNLVSLLHPDRWGDPKLFQSEFMLDKRTPRNPERLRSLLGEVMIRSRRGEESVQFPKRLIHTISVQLSPPERALYTEVSRAVKEVYRRISQTRGIGMRGMLPLLTLQREVCSSPVACALTLKRMRQRHNDARAPEAGSPLPRGGARPSMLDQLFRMALDIERPGKPAAAVQLVQQLNEQVIIFTEYRGTQQLLVEQLQQAGIVALPFDGSLSASQKEFARRLFQKAAQVLVSTESGGEGLNFQFCHNLINYDLPWNPMRIEQRIGRLHRLGQTSDVHIFNITTKGTIEEHILHLLYEKIDLFKSVIGELDQILAHLKIGKSFEGTILDILLDSEDDDEVRTRFEELGDAIVHTSERIHEGPHIDPIIEPDAKRLQTDPNRLQLADHAPQHSSRPTSRREEGVEA